MILSVYSVKGGVGKTTIAIQLAKIFRLKYLTNDEFGAIDLFNTKVLSNNKIDIKNDTLYDFGGWKTKQNIDEVIKKSDWIIIPTLRSSGDIKATITLLKDVYNLNQNVIVIFNKIKNKDKDNVLAIKKYILNTLEEQNFQFENLKFCYIREAQILEDFSFEAKSIFEIANNNFKKYIYRNTIEDFTILKKIIEKGVEK